jgi:hypothetical protein
MDSKRHPNSRGDDDQAQGPFPSFAELSNGLIGQAARSWDGEAHVFRCVELDEQLSTTQTGYFRVLASGV